MNFAVLENYLTNHYTLYKKFDRFDVYCHDRHVAGQGDQAYCDIEKKDREQ